MSSYSYLLDIAIILLSTKLLSMFTRKIHLPQVVGALLAGLVLGPAGFNIIGDGDFISHIAEIGVIILMFTAGLETDIKELKKCGGPSLIIASLGVLVPIIGGYFAAKWFNPGGDRLVMMQNIFIGVILTATSVSITVETLKELGKLSTKSGNTILGAALIDDVLGIIALTVIASFADASVNLAVVSFKIVGFFAFSAVVAVLFYKFVVPWINKYKKDLRRFSILAFFFCLIMAFASEEFFGVSDITGAFIAGLILSSNKKTTYMVGKFDTISYMIFSPVFFASVGLKVSLDNMSLSIILFSVVLLFVAILTKIIGCGLGAKLCGYTNLQSVKIGVGMISRGEVALIVATKGAALGIMKSEFFAPIIIVVVVTTIITPVLLKLVYRYQESHTFEPQLAGGIAETYQKKTNLEILTQNAANMPEDFKEKDQR